MSIAPTASRALEAAAARAAAGPPGFVLGACSPRPACGAMRRCCTDASLRLAAPLAARSVASPRGEALGRGIDATGKPIAVAPVRSKPSLLHGRTGLGNGIQWPLPRS